MRVAVMEQHTVDAEGEHRLLLAMLEDTAKVIQAGPPRSRFGVKRRTYNEAVTWVRKTGITAGAGGFSFDFNCDALGIDPTLLRAGLLRLAAKHATAEMAQSRLPSHTDVTRSQRPHVWIRGQVAREQSETPRCQ
jgi:hypothetical protein